MTIRILIVDDHPVVRDGLALRISGQADMEVCGGAADMVAAVKFLDMVRPDVAVVDIQLKNGDGIELVKRIKARDESIHILVWSMYPDAVYAQRALKAGASGYINKERSTDRIIEAIRCVASGKIYLCDETAQQVLSQAVGGAHPIKGSSIESLSDRELEVFRLIGDGLSTSEVARRLHLSPHTIETHRQRIKEKLNLPNASELTRAATRWMLQGE